VSRRSPQRTLFVIFVSSCETILLRASVRTKRARQNPRRRTRANARHENADGTRPAQGYLNRTGLAHVKSLRTAGGEHAKPANSALRCEAQTGRARVLAVVLRDISRNRKSRMTSLRIRWWTPVHGCADRACGRLEAKRYTLPAPVTAAAYNQYGSCCQEISLLSAVHARCTAGDDCGFAAIAKDV
jgi:hypothetical protein